MPRVFEQRQVFCREHNTYHYADRYCSSCRIDELKAENSLLEQKLKAELYYIEVLEAQLQRVEALPDKWDPKFHTMPGGNRVRLEPIKTAGQCAAELREILGEQE